MQFLAKQALAMTLMAAAATREQAMTDFKVQFVTTVP